MAEKTTVAFRIDESIKEEWEKAAKRPQYDSLSHLIRLAVQREIAEKETAPEATDTGTADKDSEVLQSITKVERIVTDVKDEVEAIGRESRAEELFELEQVLLEVLPAMSKDTEEDLFTGPDTGEAESALSNSTPRDIAARVGADTSDVADALERLDENTGQVQSVENRESGETYYWRVE